MKSRNIILSVFSVITIFQMVSCSSGKNYRLLSLFFDGVPPPDTVSIGMESIVSIDGSGEIPADSSNRCIVPIYTIHYPYEERECMSCHDENSPGNMTFSEPELCYMCHDDFSDTYSFIHGPVAGGYCTSCHNAHKSANDYLLIRKGDKICLWCHDLKQGPENEMHFDLDNNNCTICHNPHGGEDKFLIR